MKKFENGEITLANGTRLVIETRSLVGRPDVPNTPVCYSYPTMVKLAHNGENNGKLIAAHATLFGTREENGYKIYESTMTAILGIAFRTQSTILLPVYTIIYFNPVFSSFPRIWEILKRARFSWEVARAENILTVAECLRLLFITVRI